MQSIKNNNFCHFILLQEKLSRQIVITENVDTFPVYELCNLKSYSWSNIIYWIYYLDTFFVEKHSSNSKRCCQCQASIIII